MGKPLALPGSMKPISILLVDENPTFIHIIGCFFSEQCPNDLTLVGTATGEDETTVLAYALQPEIIFHDVPAIHRFVEARSREKILPHTSG